MSDWRGVRHKRHAVDMRLEGMSESRVNVRCMHIQIWLLAEPDSEGVTSPRAADSVCWRHAVLWGNMSELPRLSGCSLRRSTMNTIVKLSFF